MTRGSTIPPALAFTKIRLCCWVSLPPELKTLLLRLFTRISIFCSFKNYKSGVLRLSPYCFPCYLNLLPSVPVPHASKCLNTTCGIDLNYTFQLIQTLTYTGRVKKKTIICYIILNPSFSPTTESSYMV